MSEIFTLQGMDQFKFGVSEPYSSPHSRVFALIVARDIALDVNADENDSSLLTEEAKFQEVATRIATEYLFGDPEMREHVFHLVEVYLQEYPDPIIESALEFSRRPENQPQIEAFGGMGGGGTPTRKKLVSKNKKKMAAASKRKNRGRK